MGTGSCRGRGIRIFLVRTLQHFVGFIEFYRTVGVDCRVARSPRISGGGANFRSESGDFFRRFLQLIEFVEFGRTVDMNCRVARSPRQIERLATGWKVSSLTSWGVSPVPDDHKGISSLTNISVSGIKYTCQCGRYFVWPSSLRLHQKMACGMPPKFHCAVCNYKSYFKGNLKRHMHCKHKIDMY